jgi:hypothetical protein
MSCRAPLLALALSSLTLVATPVLAEDLYEVKAPGAKATVGAKATATVVLTSKNGWHVNDQAPVTLKLSPGTGLEVEKTRLVRKDLVESTQDKARFDVGFTATEPGKKTIDAEASFVICQETACKPVREKVVVAVDVAPATKK